MKKREMIIVGVALAALAYGALDYLVLSRKPAGPAATPELSAFSDATRVQLAVLTGKESDRVQYQIARAEAEWQSDPFAMPPVAELASAGKDSDKGPGVDLHYTGFIQAGRQVLAVINQMEYNVGETLLELGYRVMGISQERVVLLTDDNSELVIPLEEN